MTGRNRLQKMKNSKIGRKSFHSIDVVSKLGQWNQFQKISRVQNRRQFLFRSSWFTSTDFPANFGSFYQLKRVVF